MDVTAPGMNELFAKRESLSDRLTNNPYDRHLYIESEDLGNRVRSEVFAEVKSGLADFSSVLQNEAQWCNIFLLSVYSKYCQARTEATNGSIVSVYIGDKNYQELDSAQVLNFRFKLIKSSDRYFDVILQSPSGPYGTSNYQMHLEGVSVGENITFVHLTYAYSYNFLSKIAMDAYLATIGSGKVGFTQISGVGDSEKHYIAGARGVLERNAMRYFLAVEAFIAAQNMPANLQQEAWLNNWYSAAQHYPRQLHDFDLQTYLDIKRREFRRMHDLNP